MKKIFMVLALASVSVAGLAQSETPEQKYSVATNSFWSNWFIQVNGTATAFYGNQENAKIFPVNKLQDYRINYGASFAIGKWFTPGIGLRTKINGVWGKTVFGSHNSTSNKYWDANEQVLFNLSNLLLGYNENRVWNFIPYAGAGVSRNMSYNRYAVGGNVGLLNEFRLSKHVAVNLDINYAVHTNKFDGVYKGSESTKGRNLKSKDRTLAAEVGLTFNLGKSTWSKVPDVDAIKALSDAQIAALNAQLSDANAEIQRLKNHKCPQVTDGGSKTIKEFVSAPVSVFFNLGKSTIASRKDVQNVADLAEVAKANNAKIVVTGYADSKTGSAEYNNKLSQKRAETVANELVKLGVDRSNIETVAAGGVSTLSPISYNRRATVTLK